MKRVVSAHYYTMEANKNGFTIYDPDGKQVGTPLRNRAEAVAMKSKLQIEANAKARRGSRPCLCCGQTFKSDGIGNRLCLDCKRGSNSDDMFPGAVSLTNGVHV